MAQYPSLLFAAPGPPREVIAHVSSSPSSWRGQSPSTSLRVLPWTKWSSTSAREFSTGLTFVACSRVRQLQNLLFTPPFSFRRLSCLSNSPRLKARGCNHSLLQDREILSLSSYCILPALSVFLVLSSFTPSINTSCFLHSPALSWYFSTLVVLSGALHLHCIHLHTHRSPHLSYQPVSPLSNGPEHTIQTEIGTLPLDHSNAQNRMKQDQLLKITCVLGAGEGRQSPFPTTG